MSRKPRHNRTSRGNIADLQNPRHGRSEPPNPEPAWVEAPPGWRIARTLVEGDELTLVELVHEDGRVARFVPQAAALRVLAQADPIGRLVGSAVAAMFQRTSPTVAALDVVVEKLADQRATKILHGVPCSHANVAADRANLSGESWRTCLDCGARLEFSP